MKQTIYRIFSFAVFGIFGGILAGCGGGGGGGVSASPEMKCPDGSRIAITATCPTQQRAAVLGGLSVLETSVKDSPDSPAKRALLDDIVRLRNDIALAQKSLSDLRAEFAGLQTRFSTIVNIHNVVNVTVIVTVGTIEVTVTAVQPMTCGEGQIRSGNSCQTCPANSSPNRGKTRCECSSGFSLTAGICIADACPADMPVRISGGNCRAIMVEDCRDNEIFAFDNCIPCPTGHAPNTDQTACEPVSCPDDMIMGTSGGCEECPAGTGTVPNADQTGCHCPDGMVFNNHFMCEAAVVETSGIVVESVCAANTRSRFFDPNAQNCRRPQRNEECRFLNPATPILDRNVPGDCRARRQSDCRHPFPLLDRDTGECVKANTPPNTCSTPDFIRTANGSCRRVQSNDECRFLNPEKPERYVRSTLTRSCGIFCTETVNLYACRARTPLDCRYPLEILENGECRAVTVADCRGLTPVLQDGQCRELRDGDCDAGMMPNPERTACIPVPSPLYTLETDDDAWRTDNGFAFNMRGILPGGTIQTDNFLFAHSDDLRDLHVELRASPLTLAGVGFYADSGYKSENEGETQAHYGKLMGVMPLLENGGRFLPALDLYAAASAGKVESDYYENSRLRGFAAGVFARRFLRHNDEWHVRIRQPLAAAEIAEWRFAADARIGESGNMLTLGYFRELHGKSGATILWRRTF